MTKGKKLFISLILFVILVLGIWFVILDFTRFFNQDYSYDVFPSAILKRINVVLAVSIAWSVGKDGLNPRDSRKMKAALFFAFFGETAFLFCERLLGICLFAVCQLLLIMRNSSGLLKGLGQANYKQKLKLLLPGLVIIFALVVLSCFGSYGKNAGSSIIIVYLYGFILSISLWAGLASHILRLLPDPNSKMAAVGMICFYCCDILVGFDAVLEIGLPWLLANSFIWFFYIPALVLLALSSYRYV